MIIDQEVINILKRHFIFDKMFDLLDYDYDMQRLYNDLKLLKQDTFAPTYRFIFLHYDTEYYISNDYPGLTIINLQKILESLDIPNYFCLILSQQDLQPMCDQAKEYFAPNDSCSIAVIKNFVFSPVHPTPTCQCNINENEITKQYISLNNVGRFHRRILISLLRNKNLLDSGIVSYLGRQ